MTNLTKLAEDYINQHPSIKEGVAKEIVNYSKLARQILKENKLEKKYFNAVLVAARRFSEKISGSNYEKNIRELLRKSKVTVKTKLCRFVFSAQANIEDDIDPLHIVKGILTTTVIADDEHYPSIAERYEHYIKDKQKNLVEIAIVSPPDADKVLGFTAYLSGLLVSKGINILTVMGSYTDDIFIIEEKDLAAALSVLHA